MYIAITRRSRSRIWFYRLILSLILTAGIASAAAAQGAAVQRVTGNYAGEVVIPINKSQILEVDVPFSRVVVGNPQIADILPLSDRTLYVLGKQLGMTNLSIYAGNNRPLAVVDITVSQDIQGLKSRLNDLFPGENIEIRSANQSLLLSGTLSDASRQSGVLAVAEQYAPGRVTNLMSVAGSQQVLLAVRFAEVTRTLARDLNLNPLVTILSGDATFSFGSFDGLDLSSFGFASATFAGTKLTSLDLLIDALEAKGVIKVLAEPNLVALSGETASFLAGGEFPVPVARDSEEGFTSITVAFKEFGVSLSFTPTVLGNGLINLVVTPEVSQIDSTVAVITSGFDIPGISTRRATTTVELHDGQSFVIAGLLSRDFSDTVSQLPWLGDVPILGALFRSSGFQRAETELVIIVTPHLVTPANVGALADPTGSFIPPTDFDLFYHGQTEGRMTAAGVSGEGGVSGSYGHIVQ